MSVTQWAKKGCGLPPCAAHRRRGKLKTMDRSTIAWDESGQRYVEVGPDELLHGRARCHWCGRLTDQGWRQVSNGAFICPDHVQILSPPSGWLH